MAIIRFRKSTEIQLNLNSVGFSDWVKIPDKIDARRVSLHVAPDANVTFNLDIQSTNKETITENLNDRFIRNTEAEGITQEAFYQADSTVSGIRINLKSFTPDPDNARLRHSYRIQNYWWWRPRYQMSNVFNR